jgi:hypothetical protein
MSTLNPNKVGVAVTCTVCHQRKAPRGRSVPTVMYLCDRDCSGYEREPFAGSLWPGESEADFGFPVGEVGTERRDT